MQGQWTMFFVSGARMTAKCACNALESKFLHFPGWVGWGFTLTGAYYSPLDIMNFWISS
jgi:hypothetical protein